MIARAINIDVGRQEIAHNGALLTLTVDFVYHNGLGFDGSLFSTPGQIVWVWIEDDWRLAKIWTKLNLDIGPADLAGAVLERVNP